tara:strand:- start:875 stop:1687 length:813 start_codon:yes stop_codon:yes gene_type:complete
MKTKYKIFFAKILYFIIKIFYSNDQVNSSRNGINWSLDLNEGIDLSIFIFGNFEKSILKTAKILMPDNQIDIIDIGSNIGVHTLNFAKNFKHSRVYSIEPTNFAYNKLLKNLSLNPSIKNIFTSQYFISERKRIPVDIYSSWDLKVGKNKHKKHMGLKKSTSYAKIISLDEFVEDNKINRKTLIKCDVDGYELSIFKSGQNYFKKYKPIVMMELAPYLYKENGYSTEDFLKYIQKFNYNFFELDNLKKISNIFEYAKNINDGSSKNIILK